MKRTIEFGTTGTQKEIDAEMEKFASLVHALNRAGVPFSVRRDNVAIELTIGEGY